MYGLWFTHVVTAPYIWARKHIYCHLGHVREKGYVSPLRRATFWSKGICIPTYLCYISCWCSGQVLYLGASCLNFKHVRPEDLGGNTKGRYQPVCLLAKRYEWVHGIFIGSLRVYKEKCCTGDMPHSLYPIFIRFSHIWRTSTNCWDCILPAYASKPDNLSNWIHKTTF